MMNKKVKLQSEFKIFPNISYQHYHKKTIFYILIHFYWYPIFNPNFIFNTNIKASVTPFEQLALLYFLSTVPYF